MSIMNPALLTDKYEYTQLEATLETGIAHRKAVFEVFARRLPKNRGFGVVAGTNRLMKLLKNFRFGDDDLEFLRDNGFKETTVEYLKKFKFNGNIVAYREGDLFFPYSPVLRVEGTFGEAVLLETLVLSVLNHDSAIASAAARMVQAARNVPLIEMGGRRTHEEAAVAATRAAYIAGFESTSNMAAGKLYNIPVVGTSAHAFTLAHADELEAFKAQVEALGVETTLLVDTYDIEQGIRNAVEAAGTKLGGIRIDSGNLAEETTKARKLLKVLGALETKIIVTSDMDEYKIEDILNRVERVDGFGVGTQLVTGSGHPTAEMVYKLVEIENENGDMVPVAKKSKGKASGGGTKYPYRVYNENGKLTNEYYTATPEKFTKTVQKVYVRNGVFEPEERIEDIREFHRKQMETLPTHFKELFFDDKHQITVEERFTVKENKMKKALLVIDVQNDFTEGGSLAVTGGENLAERLAEDFQKGLFKDYDLIVSTQDYHIEPGDHFAETPDYRDTWPAHCVVGTGGELIHPALEETLRKEVDYEILKGQYEPAYSGFDGATTDGETLKEILAKEDIDEVVITGIAFDVCCKATAMDAANLGYRVTLLKDYSVGITPETIEEAVDTMTAAGIEIK